ncbi:hypothetical protein C8Q78DRAFT_1075974 [Trametes maxima]|nr:hypothetical protein C8Q78DRAFT_1075974 [Trametes maxima]
MRLTRLASLLLVCTSSYEFFVSAATTPTKRQLLSTIKHGETRTTNTLRDYTGSRRNDLQDTCMYLNSTSVFDVDVSDTSGDVPLDTGSCLCLGQIPDLVTDSQLASFVDVLGGTAEAAQALRLMVSTSPMSQACSYPSNSQPHCTRESVCGFTCEYPFTAVGNSCVRTHVAGRGNTVLQNPRGASSKGRLTKRAVITNLAGAQSTCAAHETVCGTYDGAGKTFQCVDVSISLESCDLFDREGGGCTVPSPFDHVSVSSGIGVDCSAIPHVEGVSCISGVCAVRSCRAGWIVNEEGAGCVETPTARTSGDISFGISGDAALSSVETVRHAHRSNTLHKRADEQSAAGSYVGYIRDVPEIRSEKKLHEDWVRIPDIRSEDYAEAVKGGVGGARGAPKKIQEDWVRIPDIRRAQK